ncbi:MULTISPECIES: 50S ribosomal protein L25 [Lyngbya]|uniref:Ribosomal L25p family protein n=1 Tax=Lyngbya aestuarii BL J TaxID=1348334 RepID=U7QQE5_9CYAN|nr:MULTISPECIES: 50S ribosomal protein L25 [Lyngbya]EAW38210.1 50S ribosomal protein L25 [Lyngbya sp. PCC 8106]ERT08641.1 ribosomal L25p family protein [Lyngbya aestuarii BL J]
MALTIECQKRAEGTKPKALRREGLIPAVLYGHQGTESIELTLDQKKAIQLMQTATVNKTVIELSIPHLSWNGKTVLHEVQAHPWKPLPYHFSFFAVKAE